MFKLDQNADVNGTCLIGQVRVSMPKMIRLFGLPKECDGYKVSGEWVFINDSRDVFTVYDWKMTNLYDKCTTTVEELRNNKDVVLNVGGCYGANVSYFQEWLYRQLSKK